MRTGGNTAENGGCFGKSRDLLSRCPKTVPDVISISNAFAHCNIKKEYRCLPETAFPGCGLNKKIDPIVNAEHSECEQIVDGIAGWAGIVYTASIPFERTELYVGRYRFMKRLFPILLAIVMLAFCVSAGAVASPIREVYDDDDFEDILKIEVDDEELRVPGREMVIINNEIGQIQFTLENTEGVPVAWTLRFTRKAELNGDLKLFAGVYAEDWVESEPREYTYTEPDDDDGDDTVTVTLRTLTSESANTTVYFWDHATRKGMVCYELTVDGTVSQMQFAEVFDNVMAACFD